MRTAAVRQGADHIVNGTKTFITNGINSEAPLAALRLGKLCLDAGFPPGVMNVVAGEVEAAAALAEHPEWTRSRLPDCWRCSG